MEYKKNILKAVITKSNFAGEIGDILYVIKVRNTMIMPRDTDEENFQKISLYFKEDSYYVLENETQGMYWGESFYLLQSNSIEILN
jgi:hypothetical protein